MTSSLLRPALSVCVLIGVAASCASGNTRREPRETGSVTASDIERQGGDPIEKIIQDKVPGVLVSRTPDGGLALQIRGASSARGSNEPLYVIDGSPVQSGPGGALVGVNPYDIDTIQVLKNPADIGVYGMRGANGVIVITTKKPGKRR